MANQLPVPNNNTSGRARPKPGARVLARRATGPRTLPGKQRSSKNALKHGVFSKEILLKGESRADFQSLHHKLREDLHAKGFLEELLVEQLAILIWRRKRFFNAETAEIAKVAEFVQADERERLTFEAQDRESSSVDGILHQCANPITFNRAIELLTELRGAFEQRGLDVKQDSEILHKLYGFFSGEDVPDGFPKNYLWFAPLTGPTRAEIDDPPITEEDAKRETIKCIDDEIQRLKRHMKYLEAIGSKRREYTAQAALVPNHVALERLQRYEAHLSREFDRTLSQLEHWQRIRLGQPVPPTLKVELSR